MKKSVNGNVHYFTNISDYINYKKTANIREEKKN